MTVGGIATLKADLVAVPPPGPAEYRAGPAAGIAYRQRLAGIVDSALTDLFDEAVATVGLAPASGLALAVVGSWGRRDGGPLSDLDCLLLHDGVPAAGLDALARALWYPIWDAGLRLDHSMRSLADCRRAAGTDLTAAIGLIGLRHVAGNAQLTAAASTAVLADWRRTARRRLPEVLDSMTTRVARAGELAYLVEPDIKEARGGLRDAVLVRALTASWLTDRPHGTFDSAHSHLLDVRDCLHLASGRPTARLGRQDQPEVASRLGLQEDSADALHRADADASRVVAAALDATTRRARQALAPRRGAGAGPLMIRGRLRPARLPSLAAGLIRHDGEVVLASGADPDLDPRLALRAGMVSASLGLPISPTTLTALGAGAVPGEPWGPECRALLLRLLGAGPGLVDTVEALDLAGLLVRWLPEWADVRNRPQRAPVHRHTVDRHLVETVVRLPALSLGLAADDQNLLLVAGLLHDIGKIPGASDHAVAGAERVGPILMRWGMEQWNEDITFLVRHHLLLAEALTSDPEDADVARRIAATVGTRRRLNLLLCLTEADASAVGERAWSSWRAGLMASLVMKVRAELS